jgi:hypothetical protein
MMAEEGRSQDPTRKLLRVFGVSVTNYEERTAEILERLRSGDLDVDERGRLAAELVEMTAEISERLREMTEHVLAGQARALDGLRRTLEQPGA